MFFIEIVILLINTLYINKSKATIDTNGLLLNEMYVEKMSLNALANDESVAIQQGNITVFVNTDLAINSSIANYRTQFGKGEKIKINVQFNKVVKNYSNLQLNLKFGTGVERKAALESSNNGVLTFAYTIQSGDNGELQLMHLSGQVMDNDGNTIEIALAKSDKIIYQNQIIAKTNSPAIQYLYQDTDMGDPIEGIDVYFSYSEYMYYKETMVFGTIGPDKFEYEKSIIKPTENNVEFWKYAFDVYVGGYKAKGNITIENDTQNKIIKLTYLPSEYGDKGQLAIKFKRGLLCDIAGNNVIENNMNNGYLFTSTKTIQKSNYQYTPSVTSINIQSGKGYRKAGDQIRFLVNFNDDIYKGTNMEVLDLTEISNRKLVTLSFGEQESKGVAQAEGFSGKNVISYVYTVQNGDNGYFKISINENKVYDSAGHPNKNVEGSTGSIMYGNIIADTIAPICDDTRSMLFDMTDLYYKANNMEYLRAGNKITYTKAFLEPINIIQGGTVKIKIGNREDTATVQGTNGGTEVSFTYNIKSGDSGRIYLKLGHIVSDLARKY